MNCLTTEDGAPIKKSNPLPGQLIDASGNVVFSASNPGAVQLSGSNTQIGSDQAVVFANSDPVNTQVNVDITDAGGNGKRHQIICYNPSTITDLTVKIFGKEATLGGDTRYTYYDSVTIPKAQTITGTSIVAYAKEIEGIFAGTDLRLVVSNDTELGASDGFSAYIRVKAV